MKNSIGSKIADLLAHLKILYPDLKFQLKEIQVLHLSLCSLF